MGGGTPLSVRHIVNAKVCANVTLLARVNLYRFVYTSYHYWNGL